MSLENFRKLRIVLDHIDRPIYQKTVAKEGDSNGRELEVQLVNLNVLENLSGVNLVLYWKNLAVGNQGDKDFEAVDRKKGKFRISYPEAMLNKGYVTCYVSVQQDGDKIMNTLNFTVEVEGSGYDANAAIASDDFQAMNDALLRINKYQADIDRIKNEIISAGDDLISSEKSRIRDILKDVKPKIEGLESQFNDAVANLTEDSEIITGRSSTVTGESYDTIGNRMDGMEERQLANNLDSNKKHEVFLEIKDGQPRLKLEEIE